LLEDAGAGVQASAISGRIGPIELLAGDAAAAEAELRSGYESLTGIGEVYFASTIAASLGEVLFVQGRQDEAEGFSRKAEELAPEDDVWTQAAWRSVRAKVLADRGQSREAIELAEQAVELLRATDAPVWRADGLCDSAYVLEAAGRLDDARVALEEALALYEQKEAPVPAERTRDRLNRIAAPVSAGLHASS